MISRARMTIIVGELTLRHVGKRITPHTFRHILAYAWLDAHPKDFLTLSKILFHTNINTTLRCYGARFNESNGACGMEKWVESRKRAA
jgi:integrase